MLIRYFSLIILLGFSSLLFSQTPVMDLSFDGCILDAKGSLDVQVIPLSVTSCDCGLEGEAMEFDGNISSLAFDDKINPVFNSDFTIDFYFTVLNKHDIVDILSFKKDCNSDSSFTLQYLPSINEIRFLARGSEFQSIELSMELDQTQCWHHMSIVRQEFNYFLFLDGEMGTVTNAERKYTFAPENVFSMANNSCLYSSGTNYHRFRGRIDQFKIYDYAFNNLELNKIEIKSDEILNQDTTIYLGDAIDIKMGPTCAVNFKWSNKEDLDDPASLTPTITPKKSTLYYIDILMNGISCRDSIYIHVQDKDKLDCSNLLLPNSFTPNNDGLNDHYDISNKFIIQELQYFDIYSRVGTRVFRTKDKNASWDGLYQNEKLNPGKYVYKVSYVCKNKSYLSQGILNLMR